MDNTKIAKICGVALVISAGPMAVAILSSVVLVLLVICYFLDLSLFRKRATQTRRMVGDQQKTFH